MDTLIKYLVDSLQSFENGHGHALHPIPLEPNLSFMGDHVASQPVTGEDLRQLGNFIDRNFNHISSEIKDIRQAQMESPPVFPHYQSVAGNPSCTTCSQHVQPLQQQNDATALSTSIQALSITNPPQVHKSPAPLPIPKVSIPSLGRAPGAWRRAVMQWEEIDPETGLALKDWPSKWYCGDMRTVTGSKRAQRQLVFEEFER